MELYVLTVDKIVKVYSTRDKLLKGYIEVCKTYYTDYERTVRNVVRELEGNYYLGMREENKKDLLNYIQGKEYKDIFSFVELKNLDTSFTFTVVKVDE